MKPAVAQINYHGTSAVQISAVQIVFYSFQIASN